MWTYLRHQVPQEHEGPVNSRWTGVGVANNGMALSICFYPWLTGLSQLVLKIQSRDLCGDLLFPGHPNHGLSSIRKSVIGHFSSQNFVDLSMSDHRRRFQSAADASPVI